MPLTLSWHEIALRLGLSVVAGTLLGLDRGEHGRPAGLRTTLLVCLAAAVAMIQTNLLLPTAGKASDFFSVMDVMRLPLGILTGVGFIGAGAILKRGDLVLGVTTAATLWFVTVIGLCFGGGQISLGVAGLGLGVGTLSGLRWLEGRLKRDQSATLSLVTERDSPSEQEISEVIRSSGYRIGTSGTSILKEKNRRELEFGLRWRSVPKALGTPPFVLQLLRDPAILSAKWKPS
jgi:putative Mg2+ transporter-C (MgtC) family protein